MWLMAAEDKKPICGMEGKILWIMAGRLSSAAPIMIFDFGPNERWSQ